MGGFLFVQICTGATSKKVALFFKFHTLQIFAQETP